MTITIYTGDCMDVLKTLPAESVHCVVTSPPYYRLRDYGVEGQIGLEDTPDAYIAKLVEVFREVRRVLRDDGTVWLNLGDSYAAGAKAGTGEPYRRTSSGKLMTPQMRAPITDGLKPKDLIGIPWRVAFALQADGWWLRSDIIWCLSGGTWVYAKTQKGEMPMTIKDLARLNPATVQLWNGERWTQLLGMSKSARKGDEIELVLRSGERIACTPTHKFPTSRGLLQAGDIVAGDVIERCQLPEPDEPLAPEYIGTDAAYLAGLYIAEGSRAGDTIQIAGHAKETERWEFLQRIAKHYGGSATRTIDGNKMDIRLYGKVLNAIIDTLVSGKTAKDKCFAPVVWRYSNQFLSAMLDGYLSGDGHWDAANNRWRLSFTRNYNLERDLRTVCARLGLHLTLKMAHTPYNGGLVPTFRGEIRMERSGHRNEKDMGEVVEIRKARCREVYDLGVADEPHVFALASGILTHNSKPNPMPESVRDRPTKAHEYIFLLSKSRKYYYDADAVREDFADDRMGNPGRNIPAKKVALGRDLSGFASGDGQWNENGQYTGRNRRSVWTIPTVPFSGAKIVADYVGRDGIPYKVSPDCPVHGHLVRSHAVDTGQCDEPLNQMLPRNLDSDSRPDALPVSGGSPKTSHSFSASGVSNAPSRTSGSTADRRTSGDRLDENGDAQTAARTNHTSEHGGRSDRNSDSRDQPCSPIASEHSTQTRKTDHARPTSQHDSVSAQTPPHTHRTLPSDERDGSVDHTPANNTSVRDCDDNPTTETARHNGHKSPDTASFLACTDYTCTCERVQVDHFATFPPDLVEPMVKAGTSERGCCPECGKPWERVVERELVPNPGGGGKRADTPGSILSPSSVFRTGMSYRNGTTGWRATCQHDAEPVPCAVLDPFGGAGTVALVADRLGRDAILVELNPAYAEMAARRIHDDAGMFAEVVRL